MGGVKMGGARAAEGPTRYTLRDLIGSVAGSRPLLRCLSCKATVVFVAGYTHAQGTPSERPIDPCFRLGPGAAHASGCRFTASGAIEHLVAQSRAVEDAEDLFAKVACGFEFRLGPVRDAFKDSAKVVTEEYATALGERAPLRAVPRTGTQRLSHYLKAAAGVARLRAIVEEESAAELQQNLTIRFNGGEIEWNDFYFSTARLHLLFNRLIRLREGSSDPTRPAWLDHPVAIEFCYREEEPRNQERRPQRRLRGFSAPHPGRAADGESSNFRPVVLPKLELKGQWPEEVSMRPGATYVALVQPWAVENRPWRVLNGNLYRASQLAPLLGEDGHE
jgi:hypothetical protein